MILPPGVRGRSSTGSPPSAPRMRASFSVRAPKMSSTIDRQPGPFPSPAGVMGAGEPEPVPPVLGGALGLGLVLHEFPVSGLADDPAAGGAGQIVDGQPALGAEDAGELLRPGSEDEFDD